MKFFVPDPSEYVEKPSHKAFEQNATGVTPKGSGKKDTKDENDVEPPTTPRTVEELHLEPIFLRDLLLKTMYRTNIETIARISKVMCLLPTVCEDLIQPARETGLIESVGMTSGAEGSNELRFHLTDAGRKVALAALAQSEYYGAAPIALEQYLLQAKKQTIGNIAIPKASITESMKGLVIDKMLLDFLGPAINSGQSILLYGPPGNGKSTLANAIHRAIGQRIYIPRFLEYNGQVIAMYDPVIHAEAEEPVEAVSNLRKSMASYDPRYVYTKRPCVITGGELTLDMLELTYSSDAKIYQAPIQMKATGGIFIVDDLGRQQDPPQAMINRWITPMESGEDILRFITGEKFTVPFDCMPIFSTNFHPKRLFDKAALRRIPHKIYIDGPNRDQMLQIFLSYAKAVRMEFPEEVAIHLFAEKYPTVDNQYAAFHAKFLIDQIFARAEYECIKPEISIENIDRAWENLYVPDKEFDY